MVPIKSVKHRSPKSDTREPPGSSAVNTTSQPPVFQMLIHSVLSEIPSNISCAVNPKSVSSDLPASASGPLFLCDNLWWGEGLPKWLSGKESACQVGDTDSIPGSGRFPGEGNGNPLQYSCQGNPMDRGVGAGGVTVHGVTKSWTPLSNWTAAAATWWGKDFPHPTTLRGERGSRRHPQVLLDGLLIKRGRVRPFCF